MLEDLKLEETVRMAILNLMLVLYDCGIQQVHLGGLMRLLGIPNERAAEHDNQLVELDDNFAKYVEAINTPRPLDQTLH
jgi:hypothetical protein